jgi:hypothetical protein
MNKADRSALKACMEIACRDPDRRRQLDEKRHDGESWEEVATFCCTIVQRTAMGLPPWSCVPADAIDDEPHPTIARQRDYMVEYRKAHAVAKRMIELGVSPYAPDPLAAIATAEDELRRQAAPALRVVSSDSEEPPSAA